MENRDVKGELETSLMHNARQLMDSLENRQFGEAVQIIHELNKVRDRGLYHEVGKLTRELHTAIVNFHIDPRLTDGNEASQITDATERLSYVVEMTERAANRTMDLVEESVPMVSALHDEASALRQEWQRFMQREMDAQGFRHLARRVEQFFARCEQDSERFSAQLNEIMLAQDFQDLTGQVIKRVTSLVTEVESDLIKLMLMASDVDRFTGIQHDHAELRAELDQQKNSSQGEGPQLNADKRDDVVSGQDDVDDLLSSLGF
ncbi:protein phosphatase CheZ [Serpens gallinarum]|uniref:Protein phosphatase CheZ n=1 Tax=Serpens gallinarum TaxID=2763075 RepID=A0ABR8TL70_9PSED|nr:protein phosphatase CheZ [Serpens gallinarum]MBD7976522.1 protein phosphatase CheZ [Serpens gallinarum]